jgi:GNAT superfamily N-acetyltransferase
VGNTGASLSSNAGSGVEAEAAVVAAWHHNPMFEPIPADEYARIVLPQTFALWGDGRSFERYVQDTNAIAGSLYGSKGGFTWGLREDGRIVSSFKRYHREVRWGDRIMRACGIGAVFTDPDMRGRGFSSVMIGEHLDRERAAGADLAYLYSDIHPAFYERLGFIALPSRSFTINSALLDGSAAGASVLEESDWAGVRRCFEQLDSERAWSMRRTPLVWNWMKFRWNAPSPGLIQPVQLVIRRGRSIVAYAIGRRDPRSDTFIADDFSFSGEEGRAALPRLFRAAAGDLGRIGGWLPPSGARDALPRGSVRRRKSAIMMVVPLSRLARTWWQAVRDDVASSRSDPAWSADHI